MTSPLALRADALCKSFGPTEALRDVSFSLRPGEIVGLLGPNGAGKTTTLKLFLGMLRPTRGRAEVMGLDSASNAVEVKRHLGYTPDEPAFYDFLSGRETVDFVANVRGVSREDAWRRLGPVVEMLDIGATLELLTSGYSHGTKKKLALLLALLHAPPVLLLDEPTNGLDPPSAARVRELLRDLAHEGAAVLVSTHMLDMADRLCPRVVIVSRGAIIADGTPADIRVGAGVAPEQSLEDAFLRLAG